MSESPKPLIMDPARQSPQTPPPAPEFSEDTGTQALSEALKSSFFVIRLLMILLLGYFICSGVFTVGQEEQAVILRLGKPVGDGERGLLGSGLHWAFPYPIDEVIRIPLGRVHTAHSTVGWYAVTPAQETSKTEPPAGPTLDPMADGYILTADGNIIHVRGTLRYRIQEPGLRNVLDFVNASNQVEEAFNNALTFGTARYKVDDVLTLNTVAYRETVARRLEQIIQQQHLGIIVDQLDLTPIPPRQLTAQFVAVLQADVQRGKTLNDARSYANQTVSKAEADAGSRLNAAETERGRLVEFVAADAKRFNDLLPAYRSNPALFIEQKQAETLKRIATNAEKIVLPPGPALRIQLNRESRRSVGTPEQPTAEDHH